MIYAKIGRKMNKQFEILKKSRELVLKKIENLSSQNNYIKFLKDLKITLHGM